jgi:glyoxylase-like metal-dependent hydrolase (beta-lactamase superfamily II)
MKRRDFIKTGTLAVAASQMPGKVWASWLGMADYQIRMLSDNLGIFTEQGGTIAFLKSKSGIVVVDSQFPNPAQHLIDELRKRYDETPFQLLINTHHHADHSSGNITFKGLVKHVVAHENSAKNQIRVSEEAKKAGKESVILAPDKTFQTTWNYKLDKENIKLHYFGAGHTNGDSFVHFENQNTVHTGDLVFNRRFPYIDKTAGADIQNWIKVLDKAMGTFDAKTQYIFGHALDPQKIIGTQEDIKAYQNYLEKLLEYVSKEKKAGKSLTEISKVKVIPGAEEWQGQGIERGISAAYQEL